MSGVRGTVTVALTVTRDGHQVARFALPGTIADPSFSTSLHAHVAFVAPFSGPREPARVRDQPGVVVAGLWRPALLAQHARREDDAMLARVQARGPRAPGNYVEVLAHGFAAYLRKHPTNSPSRKKMKRRFALLAAPDHVDPRRSLGICTGSPALPMPAPVARQETVEVKSRVKSARDGA